MTEKTKTKPKKATEKEQAAEPSTDSPAPPAGDSDAGTPAPLPAVSPPILAGTDEDAIHRALTAADDRQIVADLTGNAVKGMVYSYGSGKDRVTDLSWKGHMEAVRRLNTKGVTRIGMSDSYPPAWEETTIPVETGKTDDDGHPAFEQRPAIKVTVFCRDEMRGSGGTFGTAVEPLEQRLNKKGKDGRYIFRPDSFAHQKALSKAQRNAMRAYIPIEAVEELKQQYLGAGAVEYIEGTAVDVTDLPPALTDEKAVAQQERARELYQEFKETGEDPLKVLSPAAFNRYMTAAQHSHERMQDFIDYLESLVNPPEEDGE